MNRRSFLRSIGIGVAAVYLRVAPTTVKPPQCFDGALTLEQFNNYLERVFRAPRNPRDYIFYFPSAEAAESFKQVCAKMYDNHNRRKSDDTIV